MATKDENYDKPSQVEEIKNKKNNNGDLPCEDEMVKKRFEENKKILTDDITEAQNNCDINNNNYKKANELSEKLKGAWEKTQETQKEYLKINEYISLKLGQETLNFQNNVNSSKTLFTADLNGLFQESLKCIKDVEKKSQGVYESVNQLEETIKDSCNQKELRQYIKPSFDLKSCVGEFKQCAMMVCKDATENWETSIKVTGIKSLLNIDSLVNTGTEIKSKVDVFNKNIVDCITSLTEEVGVKQKDYFDSIIAKCDKENAKDLSKILKESLNDTLSFVEPDNIRSTSETIDEVNESAENTISC